MKHDLKKMILVGVVILTPLIIGCSSDNERLAQFAEQSMREQSTQNKHMANQAVAIVEESSQLAETAKELVHQDAKARQELLAHHTQLSSQLNSQQSKLDQQRQDLARQLAREPVIAAAISNVGLLLACALPLALAGLLVWRTSQQTNDDAAVASLLVHEMTTETPLFLSEPVFPKLTAKPTASQPNISDNVSEFPF
jgi:outer membrane murein-binding lipoprotein Lpp